MTAEEERNLELAKKYQELYNTDLDRFVPECYWPDFEVIGPGIASFGGDYDQFIRIEKEILEHRPERKMRVVEFFPVGDTVVVEGVGFVAFLKCRDGKIIQDRTHPTLTREEFKRRNPWAKV